MNIRPANDNDRAAIIDLLRKSLGESTIPKSEALWQWKHEQNPFGKSFVLLAEENDTLIGLRAFMQWDWIWENKKYKAIRAVDTATHPDHQGKGIFKKLTLQQIEMCKQQNVQFVFNTPNEQSRPGYLKMGWVQQGKMPLKIKILNPFVLGYAKLFDKNKYAHIKTDPTPQQAWDIEKVALVKNYNHVPQLSTAITPEYILWRYAQNPLFQYYYFTDDKNFLLISRIKLHSFSKELRLVDFILLNPDADTDALNKFMKKSVKAYCKQNNVDMVTISGQQYQHYKPYFKWLGPLPVKPLGPIVTLKDINMQEKFPEVLQVPNWNYSLGDMELF